MVWFTKIACPTSNIIKSDSHALTFFVTVSVNNKSMHQVINFRY